MSTGAEIIVVGSEIVQGRRDEINARVISKELSAIGLEPSRITLLPDDHALIASEISHAMNRSEILIVTGGLGSTVDDLTRRAAIEALGGETEVRDDIASALEARFRASGRKTPKGYSDHSVVPLGARPLENRIGAAFGLEVVRGGKSLFLLPGVPEEMREMLRAEVLPSLAGRGGEGTALLLRTTGLNEIEVEERLRTALDRECMENVSIICGVSGVDCYLRAGSWTEENRRDIIAAFGSTLYSTRAESLEEVCVVSLRKSRSTLSTAESVTGGLVASRIVSVPGASESFLEGFITYSNVAKVERVGVSPGTIERHGAVSEEVCVEMAEGVRGRTGSDFGIATTGIAGPEGGSAEKPVGLCYMGLSAGSAVYCTRRILVGNRNTIRSRAASIVLDMLRLLLEGEKEALGPYEVAGGRSDR